MKPFPALCLRDRIRRAIAQGVDPEVVPAPVLYDDDEQNFAVDPDCDIRVSRMEQISDAISATTRKEISNQTASAQAQPAASASPVDTSPTSE